MVGFPWLKVVLCGALRVGSLSGMIEAWSMSPFSGVMTPYGSLFLLLFYGRFGKREMTILAGGALHFQEWSNGRPRRASLIVES